MAVQKTVGIIPARLNSSRFPKKLLHILRDKPILGWTLERAKSFKAIDDLFVATDSLEIAKVAQDMNVKVIMTSSQPPTGTDRIYEAIKCNKQLQDADILVNLQGDHPFTADETIQEIVNLLVKDPFAEISTPVIPCKNLHEARSQDVVKVVFDRDQNALYFSRNMIPRGAPIYYRHVGLYAYKRRFFQKYTSYNQFSFLEKCEDLEQLRFLENGIKIKIAKTEDPALAVDRMSDLISIENYLCK